MLQHSKRRLCDAFVKAILVGKGTWRQFSIPLRDMRFGISLAGRSTRCLQPRHTAQSIYDRAFSVSTRALRTLKPWSEAEHQKVQDLLEQGLSSGRIAKQLENRTFYAVRRHLAESRRTPGERAGSSTKSWTPEEDEILASKRAVGLKHAEILPSLPGRSIEAVRQRWRLYLRNRSENSESRKGSWTAEELERLIDLRVKQLKSFQNIAKELERSVGSVRAVWHFRARLQVPQVVQESLRRQPGWTVEDDELLISLASKKKLTRPDIAARFPGRSVQSVESRLESLQHRLKWKQRSSRKEVAAIKSALEPVLGGTATIEQVFEQFPTFKKKTIRDIRRRMRLGLYKT